MHGNVERRQDFEENSETRSTWKGRRALRYMPRNLNSNEGCNKVLDIVSESPVLPSARARGALQTRPKNRNLDSPATQKKTINHDVHVVMSL